MVPQIAAATIAVLLTFAAATNVQQCPNQSIENLSENVQLSPCNKLPCLLKKGTQQLINIKFTPEEEVTELKNEVKANLLGIPVPFVGVDGNSVCDKIFDDAGNKVSCPLKPGISYNYKDSFPVLSFYPSLKTKVHWALVTDDEKNIMCFEVPVRIA